MLHRWQLVSLRSVESGLAIPVSIGTCSRPGTDGVIDGGANIGEFAGLVRSALPSADLVCVEPHPGCATSLRAAGYRVVEAALWHSVGTITLEQPGKVTTSCKVVESGVRAHRSWGVDTIRLDDLLIKGARILVKLDLQGAEIMAFKGMDSLWERTEAVLSEVSIGPQGSYEPIRELMAQRDFREVSTLNELETEGKIVEADKLWIRTDSCSSRASISYCS